MVPRSSTWAKSKASSLAICISASPSAPEINSPFALSNFSAFHCFGLWLAVKMIPPCAFSIGTATSTVGVVDRPRSMMSIPKPTKVCCTKAAIMGPEMRASRPMTTLSFFPGYCCCSQVPYAAANLTASIGVRPWSTRPPIVPRIPEMDLMSVMRFDSEAFVIQQP